MPSRAPPHASRLLVERRNINRKPAPATQACLPAHNPACPCLTPPLPNQVAMPDGGLITPVIKDADSTDIYTMSRAWADLVSSG